MRTNYFLALIGLVAYAAFGIHETAKTKHRHTSYDFHPIRNKFVHSAPPQIM